MRNQLLFLTLLLIPTCLFSQGLTPSITLTCKGESYTRLGIAYNPLQKLYYSVTGGSSNYPLETFADDGTYLQSISQGFDYRGAWWNPNTNTFEGNGYSTSYIWVQNLEADGLPVNPASGTTTAITDNKPDMQSSGDYDPDTDVIVYYFNGKIYSYKRVDHSLIGSVDITNLPVAITNLNSMSIVRTGANAVGVYDYTNQALYILNQATGEYVETIQLEATAPSPNSHKMSYANGYLFLYDSGSIQWKGYDINHISTDVSELDKAEIKLYPNPFADAFVLNLNSNIEAEYSIVNITGHVVEQGHISGEKKLGQNLKAGHYIIVVKSNNDVFTKRILKQ